MSLTVLAMLGLFIGLFSMMIGWPRRVGTNPHCRACDYLLIGIASERCPECGGVLAAHNVVHGEKTKRGRAFFVGLFCTLLALAMLVAIDSGSLSQIDWYHFKPAFFVMRDMHSGIPALEAQAVQEMISRDQAKSLSAKYRDRLAAEALVQQMLPTPGPNAGTLIDYVGQRLLSNDLPDQQRSQFLRQIVTISLAVRPKVALGDQIAYRISFLAHGPSANFWVEIKDSAMTVDGKVIEGFGGSSSSGSTGMTSSGWETSCIPSLPPGHHVMEVTRTVDIHDRPPVQSSVGTFLWNGTNLWHEEKKASASFDVLPDVPADYFKLTNDPTLAGPIQTSFRPGPFTYDSRLQLQGQFTTANVPANVAFDIFARFNGKEYSLGSISCDKGNTTRWGIGGQGEDIPTPPPTIDIILRSSEAAARRTVDLNEIWKGEIIYPNVPVTVTKGK
ncbi:MAG: hypothetical protein ABSG31_12995 [Tepidisphaeraceae bacterium]|jgi:hypothetical protein